MDSLQIAVVGIMACEALFTAFWAGTIMAEGDSYETLVKCVGIAAIIQLPAWGRVLGWW